MKPHNLTEKQINMIVNAAYNDSCLIERIKVSFLVRKNSEAKKIYSEYKSTSESVKQIKQIELPERIYENLKVKLGIHEEKQKSFLSELYSLIVIKPVLSGLTALLVLSVVSTSLIINQNNNVNNSYSEREVEQAELHTKHALIVVSSILSKTSNKVKKDILANTVSTEINKGISIVNQLFTEEDKNEN